MGFLKINSEINWLIRGLIADLAEMTRDVIVGFVLNPKGKDECLDLMMASGFVTCVNISDKSPNRKALKALTNGPDAIALKNAEREISRNVEVHESAVGHIAEVLESFTQEADELEESYFSPEPMTAQDRIDTAIDLMQVLLACDLAFKLARISDPNVQHGALECWPEAFQKAFAAIEAGAARVRSKPSTFLAAAAQSLAMQRLLGPNAPDWLQDIVLAVDEMKNALDFKNQKPAPGLRLP